MFSVQGWSVSANDLKSEATGASAAATGSNSTPVHSKKRKRPSHKKNVEVTEENLADLWEQVVENKKPKIENGNKQKNEAKQQPANENDSEKPQARKAKGKKAKKESKPQAPSTGPAQDVDQELKAAEEWTGLDGEDAEKEVTETQVEVKPLDSDTSSKPKKEQTSPMDKKQKGQQQTPAKDSQIEAQPKETKDKKKKQQQQQQQNNKDDSTTVTKQLAAPPKPAAPKLTPLQASMREKLISARFRHLNETLYTKPSAEAFQLFKQSPDMFVEYHEGFRRQVGVWPENPVDGYIADILARGRVKPAWRGKGDHRPQPKPAPGALQPLGRTGGTCYIADLGCGDAALAAALKPHSAKLHLNVRSFDLQTNGNPHVTAADMANLPLPDNSIDIAIFCLALMGTNWVDFVEEAYRILRWKGELWVAEIKSRFTTPGKRGKRVVDHSVGNRRKGPAGVLPPGAPIPGPKSKKAKANAAEEAELAEKDLAIEVDGEEDQRQKTDVSAFVDVLAKRGFVLREGGESQAIDLSNKMFVKMYFVKGASPVKGKGVEALKSREGQVAKPAKKKFITDEVEMDESAVLKPCVYKIR
ncbi:25S rRNA (adenine(645)-N(1))-methyltransferase [Coniochaeta pulveracea]|uniref:Ribosomal RNA-processing protein 8 n=1 Tax=Coniochaeta pulveracea TaxID=177199 RepID=A0A420YDJ6_9PEZI|nr:25S rRNA (adenine(645)-N(1))-methyltransferase [Coniochaeta pulveracea]